MFHWSDNLFFGRKTNGDVRILKFNRNPPKWPTIDGVYKSIEGYGGPPLTVLLDETIPTAQWASIIASVSATGETSAQYQDALAFHG